VISSGGAARPVINTQYQSWLYAFVIFWIKWIPQMDPLQLNACCSGGSVEALTDSLLYILVGVIDVGYASNETEAHFPSFSNTQVIFVH